MNSVVLWSVVYRQLNTIKIKWEDVLFILKEIIESFQTRSLEMPNIWIFGDFNLSGVDWEPGVGARGQAGSLWDLWTTYWSATRMKNILSLVLWNNEASVLRNECIINLTFTAHNLIITQLKCESGSLWEFILQWDPTSELGCCSEWGLDEM